MSNNPSFWTGFITIPVVAAVLASQVVSEEPPQDGRQITAVDDRSDEDDVDDPESGNPYTRDESAEGTQGTSTARQESRIANRIANRLQTRIKNRLDPAYDPTANPVRFVEQAEEERLERASRNQPR